MGMNGGIVLVNTSIISAGTSAVGQPFQWGGGQGVIVTTAQAYGSFNVYLVGVGSQNRYLKVNSGTITAEGLYFGYFPNGKYQVHATGSSVGLFVGMSPTP